MELDFLKVIDEKKNVLADSFWNYMNLEAGGKLRRLILQNNVTGCTMMVNRTLLTLMKKKVKIDNILEQEQVYQTK